ncbi:hypothetical protein [Rhizobium herbae]|uniref:Uncharacterized protein n=1 Tax=Rhizobium herbae TaxID=508661 RepID=A0ABS4EIJ6_9HYPH|nr:hypothetical protein [Rhizobium herbae]MBP1857761.1 hypothetical protein [Rhizobium herbae]
MPILTVKTSVTAAAQAAAVVETATPRERTLPLPVRISGNQSEAVLKILETLNRHLVGSEPLPKEALIRLLDTLAKILKFPPLPQETLRDFSKRLAVFLETLPPAARLALEKQLGQRNLAVSIRILAEALKTPSIIDTPRLLDRLFTPAPVARAVVGQPDGKPAPALPVPQGQAAVQGRQIALPATQALVAGPAIVPDPGLLQAALKKAFGDDDDLVPPVIAVEENETEQSTVTTPRRDDPPAKAPTAQPQQPAKAGSETIPLLRAAAAFLAADPEALSLVAAIATGDIDSRIKIELEQELGLDLSEQTEPMDLPEQTTQSEPRKPAEQPPLESRPASDIRASNGKELPTFANPPASRPDLPLPEDLPLAEDLPLPEIDAEPTRFFSAEPDVVAETTNTSAKPPLLRTINEVDGFKGHDLGEWELEPESQSLASAEEAQPATFEPETGRPEKTLVQTLKALVEASLPLPGGAVDGPDTLFAALAGETADMGAETLFAQLEAADDAGALPDTALLTADIGDKAEPLGFEPDSWSALLDEPAEKTTNRPALAPPSTMDERAREAQTPRLADTGIVRDAIPFAMIPYLPAKTQDTRTTKIEDEEQPAFAEDEDEGRREEGGDQPENRGDDEAAASQTEAEEPENDAGAAYDLYRRMGGLG